MTQRSVYEKLNNLVCDCIIKAIVMEFEQLLGDDWFNDLKANDITAYNGNATLLYKTSLRDCTIGEIAQVLIDNNYFRDILVDAYNQKFNDVYGDSSQLVFLLRRLVDISSVEPYLDTDTEVVYGFDEAARDLIKLAELFGVIADDNDEYYYDKMTDIYNEYLDFVNTDSYSIEATIESEGLKVNREQFLMICEELGYDILLSEDIVCFRTNDYSRAVEHIRQSIAADKTKKRLKSTFVLTACLSAFAVIAVMLGIIVNPLQNYNTRIESRKSDTDYVELIQKINACDNPSDTIDYFYLNNEIVFDESFLYNYENVREFNNKSVYSIDMKNDIGDKKDIVIIGMNTKQFSLHSFNMRKNGRDWQIDCRSKGSIKKSTGTARWDRQSSSYERYSLCADITDSTDSDNLKYLGNNIYYVDKINMDDFYRFAEENHDECTLRENSIFILPEYILLKNGECQLKLLVANSSSAEAPLGKYAIEWSSADDGICVSCVVDFSDGKKRSAPHEYTQYVIAAQSVDIKNQANTDEFTMQVINE